jgi:hypothetical protein
MTNLQIFSLLHDILIASIGWGGAFIAGYFTLRATRLSMVEQREADYRRRKRDRIEEISVKFLELSEATLEQLHIHILITSGDKSGGDAETARLRLNEITDPMDILIGLRRLRGTALVFNLQRLAELLGEFISLDCDVSRQISLGDFNRDYALDTNVALS